MRLRISAAADVGEGDSDDLTGLADLGEQSGETVARGERSFSRAGRGARSRMERTGIER